MICESSMGIILKRLCMCVCVIAVGDGQRSCFYAAIPCWSRSRAQAATIGISVAMLAMLRGCRVAASPAAFLSVAM